MLRKVLRGAGCVCLAVSGVVFWFNDPARDIAALLIFAGLFGLAAVLVD